jgi:hyaluronan synthase
MERSLPSLDRFSIDLGPGLAERRRHRRQRVELETRLRSVAGFWGASPVEARIIDVSSGGARVEVPRWLDPGEWILLDLPRLDDRARLLEPPDDGTVLGRVRATDVVATPEGRYRTGLSFDSGAGARLRYLWSRALPALAFAALLAALLPLAQLKQPNVSLFWLHPISNSYGLLVSVFIVSRLLLALLYRPPEDTGYRPKVTAVVACKNEEASIARTIECLYRSQYPADRLEVIAVDDGSTDRTLSEMLRVARDRPSLRVVSFTANRGKRHAMAAGARMARGEVLVYVDSDSFLRTDALRKLASAFADPRVGAVCGHADVQNARVNFLTRMQEVRYYVAFRVVKAAESLFAAVTCCSGCLAAYRRSAVMDVLDHWLEQRFLGVPATFGDDRSLTRLMLKRYRVLYHSEATCTTIVPERWPVFFRQQLRWKKSWVRESLLLSTFMWKRHPLMVASFYMSLLFPLVSPAIALRALGLPLLGMGSTSLLYLYGVALMASLYALVYLARHRNWLWVYGIAFSVVYIGALAWQTYYAVLTVRHNQWGTR